MTTVTAQKRMVPAGCDSWSEPNIQDVIAKFQKNIPVQIGQLARELGIAVYTKSMSDGVSGMLLRERASGGPSGYSIIVNSNHPKTRQRFTIALEVGHFVLHKSSVGDGVQHDYFYRSHLSAQKEAEAIRYAASLLMPMSSIHRLIDEGITDPKRMAARFMTSGEAMANRLGLPT